MIDVSLVLNVMLGVCAGLVLFNILKISVWVMTGTSSSLSEILKELGELLGELRRALRRLDMIEFKLERIRLDVMGFRAQQERLGFRAQQERDARHPPAPPAC